MPVASEFFLYRMIGITKITPRATKNNIVAGRMIIGINTMINVEMIREMVTKATTTTVDMTTNH